jgi:hypothetical protein
MVVGFLARRQLGRRVRRCSTARGVMELLPTRAPPVCVDDEEFASLLVAADPTMRAADAIGASAIARVCKLVVQLQY